MRTLCRLLLLIVSLSASQKVMAQGATFAIDGFTLGAKVSAEELQPFECLRSSWAAVERECRKKKEWKQVSASTALYLDDKDQLKYLSQKFNNIDMTEKSIEEVIDVHSKRFKLEPRRIVKQIGADKAVVAVWGAVELEEIDVRTRLAMIQGRKDESPLLIDMVDNIQKSAADVLPIYEIKNGGGAIWTFYLRAGAPGWAMARIFSPGMSARR